MEARKVTFTAKPGTFRDAVRAYKKYKEEKSYTKAELNAMLDEAEARFEAGLGIPDEDAWDDLEEELALQEEEQHEMAKML